MRRAAGLALLAAVVLATAACGGSSQSTASQARSVVERFYSFIESGQGAAACDLLTPAAKKEVVRPLKGLKPREQLDCQQWLQSYSEAVKGDAASLKEMTATKFGSVSIVGDRAVVAVTVPHAGLRAAPLVETSGGWRISQIGTSFRNPISG